MGRREQHQISFPWMRFIASAKCLPIFPLVEKPCLGQIHNSIFSKILCTPTELAPTYLLIPVTKMTVWDDMNEKNKQLAKKDREKVPAECRELNLFEASLGRWNSFLGNINACDGSQPLSPKERGELSYMRCQFHMCIVGIKGCLNVDNGFLKLEQEDTPMLKKIKKMQLAFFNQDEDATAFMSLEVFMCQTCLDCSVSKGKWRYNLGKCAYCQSAEAVIFLS